MTLLKKMDQLVYATRLDRLIFMKIQPRSYRWTPLFLLAVLIAGYVLMEQAGSLDIRKYLIGSLVFYGAFLAAALLRQFGPRFIATARHPLDERELMVKARAHALSGLMLASFTMLGCFYMAGANLFGLWHPSQPYDWINLGFGVQAAGMLFPTLIASWLEPRPRSFED
jgi:hypothetical protein